MFVEGWRGKGQRAAGKEEKTTEGGRDAEGKDGPTVDGGEREKKNKESERKRHTTNFVNFKSRGFKISKRFQRWGSVKTSERVDGTQLGLFHGFHCEPFTTFSFERKEGGRGRLTVSRSTEQTYGLKGVGRRERTHLDEILGVVGIELACHCFVAK